MKPRPKANAPPDRAATPVKKPPVVQPAPTVAPIAIKAPPTKPFISSPTGATRIPNSLESNDATNAPIITKIFRRATACKLIGTLVPKLLIPRT